MVSQYLRLSKFQAGITAWGIGCGKENVPGVYASLTESVCFIDWATKCKHGDKYIDDFDFGKGLKIRFKSVTAEINNIRVSFTLWDKNHIFPIF